MPQLTEQEVITIAHERLKRRDAEIFCWYYYGKTHEDGTCTARWTYTDLQEWFLMARREISSSLQRSRPIILASIEAAQQNHISAAIEDFEIDRPLEFRIWCQFGHHSIPRTDTVQQQIVNNRKLRVVRA